MKKKLSLISVLLILCMVLSACGSSSNTAASSSTSTNKTESSSAASTAASKSSSTASSISLKDGTYKADFETDSSMFRINEALDKKCTLTVKDGKATAHIVLVSKNILKLYVGLAEDASKEGAVLLEPTTETVKYKDGTTEETYAFDVPIEIIDKEFDLAIIGKKDKWYDHKVKVTNVVAE